MGYGPQKGAGDINGGPYHFKLSTLDGASLGSQDNQIMASSIIIPPPPCPITGGSESICEGGTTATFSGPADMDSYQWTISPLTGATINGSGQTVTVTSNTPGTYTLTLVTTKGGVQSADNCSAQITVTDNPDVTANSATICEGESINLSTLITDPDGGTITFHISQSDADAGINALNNTTVSPTAASTVYHVRSTSTANTACYGTTTITISVVPCSRITLQKLTDGAIDNSKTWNFAIYEGTDGFDRQPQVVVASESTTAGNNSNLFGSVVLSANKTYTLCELQAAAGWSQTWMVDTDGDGDGDVAIQLSNIYNPDADNQPAEDLGNRCVEIGFGTSYPLPTNVYSTTAANRTALHFVVDNDPPPGGNARTPGYWKNWNTCTGGNQVQTAVKNGGATSGFYLLDNHLPLTLWANSDVTSGYTTCNSSSNFVIADCNKGVQILNTKDNQGRNQASDAAYNLGKHLLAYLLNKASNTYNCGAAATAASEAKALLASICFNGSGSYLDPKVKGALASKRARALVLAGILDQYNNNDAALACGNVMSSSNITATDVVEKETAGRISISAFPNPYSDKVRFMITSPVAGQATLELFNIMGQKVRTVFNGQINANAAQSVEYTVPSIHQGNLIYILRVNGEQVTGKLLNIKR
jgi:hypothetical protein